MNTDGSWYTSSYSGKQGNCVQTRWTKATHSNGASSCVEVQRADGDHPDRLILVRDSKYGDHSAVLAFTPAEWDAFIQGVKDGEFNLPEKVNA